MAWSVNDASQVATANLIVARVQESSAHWQRAIAAPGLAVFTSTSASHSAHQLHLLEGQAGAVIGSVFRRNSDPLDESICRKAAFDGGETTRIVATGARHLVQAYWGSYVAFVRDAERQTRWVLRSPINAPLCLQASVRGVSLYFSAMDDLLRLKLMNLSVNWSYVATYVALGLHRSHETGLNEVSELELGECVEISDRRISRNLYWQPGEIAKSGVLEDSFQAAAALRATTRSCIHTWASCYENILLRLSGGVDSSILLACLKDAPTKPGIAAIHRYWPGPLADERRFARSAAAQAGCELIEVEETLNCKFDDIHTARLGARPHTFAFLEAMRMEIDIAQRRNAAAFFCGTLGDAVFHYAPAMPAAAEYLSRHGLKSAFISVALDVAEIEGVSLWRVLRLAFRDSVFNTPTSHWISHDPVSIFAKDNTLVPAGVLQRLDLDPAKLTHPWLHAVKGVPAGKLWQIRWLPFDAYWRNPYSQPGDPESVPPFAAEPVVEMGLRIPTYLNVTNGWDRAVARLAFSQDLPETIRRRKTKGTPDAWVRNVIATNREFIRETLLEGALVGEKLLDPRKIEEALPGSPSRTRSSVACIVQHLCTETWIRNWTGAQASYASL